jgi:hypothetical protein
VVVLGVDVGDAEPPGVQGLGEVEHGRDVALRRLRDEHRVRPGLLGAHRRWNFGAELPDPATISELVHDRALTRCCWILGEIGP